MSEETRIAKLLNEAKQCGVSDAGLTDVLMDYFCADDGGKCYNNL
jgi:hypothetical protein